MCSMLEHHQVPAPKRGEVKKKKKRKRPAAATLPFFKLMFIKFVPLCVRVHVRAWEAKDTWNLFVMGLPAFLSCMVAGI